MSFWSVSLPGSIAMDNTRGNRADNAEPPGPLQLERAAAGASARAEHSTAAGALLHFGVCSSHCVVNSQCAGCGRLNGHPAASRVPKVSRFRVGMFNRPF